jgi:alpha-amylase
MKRKNKLTPLTFLIISLLLSSGYNAQDRVLLQGFYWDVIPGGVWYDTLLTKADTIASVGFTEVWFPAPSKGAAGGFDVGYIPRDYYDLGNYGETRYGTKQELIDAVAAFRNRGVAVYSDIVLNHRGGGSEEDNIYSQWFGGGGSLAANDQGQTWTSFPSLPSGRMMWNDGDEFFYPNASVNPDNTGDFYSSNQYDYFSFYTNFFSYDNALHDGTGNTLPMGDSLKVWGDWLTNEVGYDGYRLDFPKGIHPVYLKDWLNHGAMNGKFYVGEVFDGNIGVLKNWLDWHNGAYTGPGAAQTPGTSHPACVFDFNMRFAYKAMSDNPGGYDIRWWHGAGLTRNGVSYEQSAPFVDNHDFDRLDYNNEINQDGHAPVVNKKLLCYAHLLMSPGIATVWWRDLFYYGLRDQIEELVKIRRAFVSGGEVILTALGGNDSPAWTGFAENDARDMWVSQRLGDGEGRGVILALNKNDNFPISVWVTSQLWAGQRLYDVTGNVQDTLQVYADGRVLVKANANSYSIFVPLSYKLESPVNSGHFPRETIGFTDGNMPRAYTNAPNYRQSGNSLSGSSSDIRPGEEADLFALLKFDTSDKNVFLVYTIDGTAPTKNNGTSIAAQFVKSSSSDRFWVATVPSNINQLGTTVNYVFYVSDTDLESSFGRIAGESGVGSQYQSSWSEGDLYFSYKVSPSVNGTLTYSQKPNSPMENSLVTLEVDGTTRYSSSTTANGEFSFAGVEPQTYKTNGSSTLQWGGANATDALHILRFMTGRIVFSDLQEKAADVTGNNVITSNDALTIVRRFVGLVTEFNSGDWAIEEKEIVVSDANQNIDLSALAYGDVDASLTPGLLYKGTDINVISKTIKPSKADRITIPVSLNGEYNIAAVSLNVKFNSKDYNVHSIRFNESDYQYNVVEDVLKFAAFSLDGNMYKTTENLIEIIFERITDNVSAPLSLEILNGSEFANSNGEKYKNITLGIPVLSANIPDEYKLDQNYPNPFNPETTIKFSIPQKSSVRLEVYNMIGELVEVVKNEVMDAGYHNVKWNANSKAVTSGIYVYKLTVNNSQKSFTKSKKMILLK